MSGAIGISAATLPRWRISALPGASGGPGTQLADRRHLEPPLAVDPGDLLLAAALHHQDHALLGLGEHHLVGREPGFAQRHLVEVEHEADLAARGHLEDRAREPGGAHVLDRDDRRRAHRLEAGLEQDLLDERVADLHGRLLLLALGVERLRSHRGAVDAVAAGATAGVEDRVARPRGLGLEDALAARDAQREGVDQDVLVVAGVEAGLAADRRDPHAVAVGADAAHHAVDQRAHARRVDLAERQRVHAGDRPRAHGEDVAQDPADAGRGALERLDEARVVVALHLEDRHPAVPDVDHAGVLARPLQHPRPRGRELAQVDLRRLVRAVLRPERRSDAELGQGRIAAEEALEPRELLAGEAVLAGELDGDDRLGGRGHRRIRGGRRGIRGGHRAAPTRRAAGCTMPWKRPRPSMLPSTSSAQRSGCGIRPSTLPASLTMPAIARAEPFGVPGVVLLAGRRDVAEDDLPVGLEPVELPGKCS